MQIHDITAAAGAQRRKRVGRGEASGSGKTSGRGTKGMGARAGHGPHPLHEGGGTPIFRKTAKRGSNFIFRTEYAVINFDTLSERFEDGDRVTPDELRKLRLIPSDGRPLKLLGRGELKKKLTVEAHAASEAAKAAIEKAGGKFSLIPTRDSAELAKKKRNSRKAERAAKATKPVKAD